MKRIVALAACLTAIELVSSMLWLGRLPHKGEVVGVFLIAFVVSAFAWAFEKDEDK